MSLLPSYEEQFLHRLREHADLFESHPQAMWIYDTNTLRVLAVNNAAIERYGYTRDEFLSMTLLDFRPPEEAEELRAGLRVRFRGPRSVRARHVRKDGQIIDVEVRSTDLEDCEIPARIVVAQDISDALRSAEALAQAEGQLQYVLSVTPAVIYRLMVRGDDIRPMWVSANITTYFGYSTEEGLDSNWWFSHVHPDDLEGLADDMNQLRQTGHLVREYRFRHNSGEYRWVRDEQRIVRGSEDDAFEIVGAWVDITRYKSLEVQFQQAQKMEAIGQLAGGIAHDFNNLLTVIRSYAEMAMEGLPAGNAVRLDIDEITKAADSAARLTRQLLAFSRQQVLDPTIVDLNQLVNGLTYMIERVIGEDVEVLLDLADDAPAVRADVGQLEQVFMNLAVNARDAMPSGGVLHIGTKTVDLTDLDESVVNTGEPLRPGSYTVLTVTDTGTGMSREVASRIFEPFFTTKEVGKGTGLGLATVYGIVTQSGGRIWVQSTLGRGTTFGIALPTASTHDIAAGAARTADVESRRPHETILLVDDEPTVRTVVRATLVRNGYVVLEASNGVEALERARSYAGEIHLLLTDLVMPRLGGVALAETLRQLRPGIRILFTSGYPGRDVALEQSFPQCATFLAKPFTPHTLLEGVARAIG